MASHGARKEMALQEPAVASRKPKKELMAIHLKKADNGGVVAEHRMITFDGKEPVHAFGADEGHKLAAHLQEHLGIKMPSVAGDESEED